MTVFDFQEAPPLEYPPPIIPPVSLQPLKTATSLQATLNITLTVKDPSFYHSLQ